MKKVNDSWNLKTENPELSEEWHPIKNNGFTPNMFAPKSGQKVWWQCKKGHEWKTSIHCRSKGSGCPYCSGKRCSEENCLAINFPQISEEWNCKKNNISPFSVSFGSVKKYWWCCKEGHEWKTSPNNRTGNGSGCPYCARQICTPEVSLGNLYKEISKQWHPLKNGILTPYDVFPGSDKKVWWSCKNGHEWKASINSRVYGRGCPHCSKRISKGCKKWLDILGIGCREKYFLINGKKIWVDGFDSKNNIIYEYLGDYWHGNPRIFSPAETNKVNKRTFGYLLKKTFNKFNLLVNAGFCVIYKWESEETYNILKGK